MPKKNSDIPPETWTVSPALFAHYCSHGKWVAYGEYLITLSNALMQVAAGKIKHLMVFMPPRHGKSELTSKYFPAWFLGYNPDKHVILTSYEADFAASWGRKARNVLTEFGPELFNIMVSSDSSAANSWGISGHTGGMNTAGVGGAITGKGAHCLPGETRIHTNFGLQRMDEIIERNKCDKWYNNWLRVLAYDNTQQKPVWKRIAATQTIRNRRLLEITTSRGNKIRATDEHRFFVCGRGYTEAHSLRKGDELLTIDQPFEQDMRILWVGEERQGCAMHAMLSEAKDSPCGSGMYAVWENIRNPIIRLQESIGEGTEGLLLFNRMFTEAPRGKECEGVYVLWGTDARKTGKRVLLGDMPECSETNKENNHMSCMWCWIPPTVPSNGALLCKVCRRSTCKKDDRAGESELQRREELFKVVRFDETVDTHTGWKPMCCVYGNEGFTYTPHRRGYWKQFIREPDNALQVVSYYSPQIKGDTVSTIERVGGDSHTVYDIQVEDCNNFFAENILVHNCLIIDDPIKNAEQANSKVYRDKTYEWYKSTAYTRLEPGGAVIIIQTRWHEDDLSGRLLKEEPDKWTVINFPALAEEKDTLGRLPGESLSPHRYNVDALMKIKSTLGPYWWNALYQQRPTAQEGSIFKNEHFKYCTIENGMFVLETGTGINKMVPYNGCMFFQMCDPAVSTKASADYFVLITWALTPDNDLIRVDSIRTRLEGPDQVNLFRQAYMKWKPAFQGVESVGIGKTLYQLLLREGLPIREFKADTDKVTRAMPAAARMAAGCIYLLRSAPGLSEFEEELLAFPKGTHDDQVDCLSNAVIVAIEHYSDFDLSALIRTIPRR